MPEHTDSTNFWRILCKPLHPLITSVPTQVATSRRFLGSGRAGNGTQPANQHLGKCARDERGEARIRETGTHDTGTTETQPNRNPTKPKLDQTRSRNLTSGKDSGEVRVRRRP